jgi:hypothetical protein
MSAINQKRSLREAILAYARPQDRAASLKFLADWRRREAKTRAACQQIESEYCQKISQLNIPKEEATRLRQECEARLVPLLEKLSHKSPEYSPAHARFFGYQKLELRRDAIANEFHHEIERRQVEYRKSEEPRLKRECDAAINRRWASLLENFGGVIPDQHDVYSSKNPLTWGLIEALYVEDAEIYGCEGSRSAPRTLINADWRSGDRQFDACNGAICGNGIKIFDIEVLPIVPNLNQRKKRSVKAAIKALGRATLAGLKQKERESRIIEHVMDRTSLSVSDRYVRKIWSGRI